MACGRGDKTVKQRFVKQRRKYHGYSRPGRKLRLFLRGKETSAEIVHGTANLENKC